MRILIVKLGAIGDVVHALPALAALRRSMPEARIAWAVEQGGAAQLLRGCARLDELIELDLRGWRRSLMNVGTQTVIRKAMAGLRDADRKSTRLNSSHVRISYAVFCLKKKKQHQPQPKPRRKKKQDNPPD